MFTPVTSTEVNSSSTETKDRSTGVSRNQKPSSTPPGLTALSTIDTFQSDLKSNRREVSGLDQLHYTLIGSTALLALLVVTAFLIIIRRRVSVEYIRPASISQHPRSDQCIDQEYTFFLLSDQCNHLSCDQNPAS